MLSLNGKVDASTGDDMPTQVLSGALPVALLRQRDPTATLHAGVVGLASGITARAALNAGADRLTVVVLSPPWSVRQAGSPSTTATRSTTPG